ncbi:hypothetical protein, partial [Acetobacter papayae]|uniref:hypothetical protein n=1 Tax=Acetobacter papayae TaxID=1076592 RepID=UPI001F229CC2
MHRPYTARLRAYPCHSQPTAQSRIPPATADGNERSHPVSSAPQRITLQPLFYYGCFVQYQFFPAMAIPYSSVNVETIRKISPLHTAATMSYAADISSFPLFQ